MIHIGSLVLHQSHQQFSDEKQEQISH